MPGKYLSRIILVMVFILLFSSAIWASALELGDSGEAVKQVQQDLYDLGYDLEVDGIFGYQTREVLKDFQLNQGIIVDGIAGGETVSLLHELTEDIHYLVKKGDNLSTLAKIYDVNIDDIRQRNNLNSDLIKIGQELIIPKTGIGGGDEEKLYANIIHEVQPGDALSLISKKYGTDIETIKLANNLRGDKIIIGRTLLIPHVERSANKPFSLSKGNFIWPVIGRISSGYGYRIHPIRKTRHFHEGIDIAVPTGTRIKAAASGTIVQSGYKSGFGYTIIIDHGEGIRTLYAHNSRLLVRTGSKVNMGQTVALAGSTGSSTGSHLDFRIYQNGKTVNPLVYLP